MGKTVNKSLSNESDHQLNTLTDVVRIVGETLSDVKVIDRKVDRLEQKIEQQSADIAELKTGIAELKTDNAEIKGMLQALLSR